MPNYTNEKGGLFAFIKNVLWEIAKSSGKNIIAC
jgi:hypothetical protein